MRERRIGIARLVEVEEPGSGRVTLSGGVENDQPGILEMILEPGSGHHGGE
jgi:hypothetical protein